jgi:hypothetical protein
LVPSARGVTESKPTPPIVVRAGRNWYTSTVSTLYLFPSAAPVPDELSGIDTNPVVDPMAKFWISRKVPSNRGVGSLL